MIEVKVLREHGNAFDGRYLKKKGETYSLPENDAATLAEQKLVQIVKAKGGDA